MSAWWPRKFSKNKEEQQQNQLQHQTPPGNNYSFLKSPIKTDNKKAKDKPKSFDEVFPRGSPRVSKDFGAPGGSTSAFSGFDSDGPEKRGHPLPRPSVSSTQSLGIDHGVGLGSGSFSGSSVSSSGSSEDHPVAHDHGQFSANRLVLKGSPAFGFGYWFLNFFGQIRSWMNLISIMSM